jgi:phosphatidylglycerol:prolipoprotein diacylglycerol transferase
MALVSASVARAGDSQRLGPGFVHNFDLVMARPFGVPTYWYGFAYTAGFAGMLAWLVWRRTSLGWTLRDVLDAVIVFCASILFFGRVFDILVYEWDYYREHLAETLNWWRGGMASHGLLLGATVAALAISRWKGISFLRIADELILPGALMFGLGRIGNFIEGGVIGTVTDLPWGVKFPDVDGFRHPVALYDGAKNLMLIPLLVAVLRRHPAGSGRALAAFVFWYAALRFLVDQCRDYEAYVFGMGTGQYFNLLMAAIGLGLWAWLRRRPTIDAGTPTPVRRATPGQVGLWRPVILAALIAYPLGIPTSWTLCNIDQKRQNTQTFRAPPAVGEADGPAAIAGIAPNESTGGDGVVHGAAGRQSGSFTTEALRVKKGHVRQVVPQR